MARQPVYTAPSQACREIAAAEQKRREAEGAAALCQAHYDDISRSFTQANVRISYYVKELDAVKRERDAAQVSRALFMLARDEMIGILKVFARLDQDLGYKRANLAREDFLSYCPEFTAACKAARKVLGIPEAEDSHDTQQQGAENEVETTKG